MKNKYMSEDITKKIFFVDIPHTGKKIEVQCLFESYPRSGTLSLYLMKRNPYSGSKEFSVVYQEITIEDTESTKVPDNCQFLSSKSERKWRNWLIRNKIVNDTVFMDVGEHGDIIVAYEFNIPEHVLRRIAKNRRKGYGHSMNLKIDDVHDMIKGRGKENLLKTSLYNIKDTERINLLYYTHTTLLKYGLSHVLMDCCHNSMFDSKGYDTLDFTKIHITIPGRDSLSLYDYMINSPVNQLKIAIGIYRQRLLYCITELLMNIRDGGIDRREIEDYMIDTYAEITDAEILTRKIQFASMLTFRYSVYGINRRSKIILIKERDMVVVLVPSKWEIGSAENIYPSNDLWKVLDNQDRLFRVSVGNSRQELNIKELDANEIKQIKNHE